MQRRLHGLLASAGHRIPSRKNRDKKKRAREKNQIVVDESIALPDPQTLLLDQARPRTTSRAFTLLIQGGPTGQGTWFVDIKLKVPPQYKLIILQPANIGLPTENGKKLSCSQAQLGQATCLAAA